jgi:voltage-gated potassium channel
VPAGFPHPTFGDCQTHFGRSFGATVLAVREGGDLRVSPPWDTPLAPGATLYYVAGKRIDPARLAPGR